MLPENVLFMSVIIYMLFMLNIIAVIRDTRLWVRN
jgi:hypothetical protein